MSDQLPPFPPAFIPTMADDYAFRRRRAHAHIGAMTGLILQAIKYPTKRHREFISIIQSINSGNDSKVPYTPFRRAHLTVAEQMKFEGTEDSRRKAVTREIRCLNNFQRRTGIVIFHVTPGNKQDTTEYIDYLTPLADAAMQRALSSRLWKTGKHEDKAEAKREAVAWAVSMLPRMPIEKETEEEARQLSLHDYERVQEERFYQSIERTADEIEKRGGDHRWIERVAKQLLQIASSRKKTAGARRSHLALCAPAASAPGLEGGAQEGSGDLYNGGQFCPPLPEPEWDATTDATAAGGGDRTVPPSLPIQPQPGDVALEYARRGWAVFPLHHPDANGVCSCSKGVNCDPKNIGKHPRTKNGHTDATTDERQVRSWWRKWPRANVGLAMGKASGLVALDVDPRAGGDASLTELFDEHGAFETLEAVTGGGGFHFLFAHPGVNFKNSSSKIAEGLDVKTDGGYIVAAPSLHASGKRYQWRGEAQPSPMPEWLLTLILTENAKPQSTAAAGATVRRAAAASRTAGGALILNGERNERLFRIACAHRGKGATREEIEAAVAEAYESRCEKTPPMGPDEFRKIAGSAMRYQPEAKKRAPRAEGVTP